MRSICPHSGGGGYGHGGHECRGAAALALRGGAVLPANRLQDGMGILHI